MKKTKELTIINSENVVIETKEVLRTKMKMALKEIDKKLKKINYTTNYVWKTTGSFKFNELDSNTVNVINSVDLMYLIRALSLMERTEKEYNETAASIGLINYPICMWCGHPVKSWISDIKIKIVMITNSDIIKDLTDGKKRLETFLSEEDRLSQTLKDISKIL